MAGWQIVEGCTHCRSCAKDFVDGDPIMSAVQERHDDDMIALERHDYCLGCWTRHGVVEHYDSYWRRKFIRPPEKEKPKKVNGKVLFDLFRRFYAEGGRGTRIRLAYMIGLLLVRRKMLTLRLVSPGRVELVYNDGEEIFSMQEPSLPETEMASLKDDLSQLLQGALD